MSLEPATHPSFFALDKASLGLAAADVQSHLASCAACRNYVSSVGTPPPSEGVAEVRAHRSAAAGTKPAALDLARLAAGGGGRVGAVCQPRSPARVAS
jgi:hypothetical protein